MKYNLNLQTLLVVLVSYIFFYATPGFSKDVDIYKKELIANYFNGILSSKNKNYPDAIKYLNNSKQLKKFHKQYLKELILAQIYEGKISQALYQVKISDNNLSNFYETNLITGLQALSNKNYQKASQKFNLIIEDKGSYSIDHFVALTLLNYTNIFREKKISNPDMFAKMPESFGEITKIQNIFINCYLDKDNTNKSFLNLIGINGDRNERYVYFYINYLITKNKISEANQFIAQNITVPNTNLILKQTKNWINNKNLKQITKIFNCKNQNELISEFLYLIATIYSSENIYDKSNFYLNLSLYLNPKFIFNKLLKAENLFDEEQYIKAKKIYQNYNKENIEYYWHSIKKLSYIISKLKSDKIAIKYIEKNFKNVKNPTIDMILDIADFFKNHENFEQSIKYYSKALKILDKKNLLYAKILFKRGASYERIKQWDLSDKDLLMSLQINPKDPQVLNYLAYSWLERNYKLEKSMSMLNIAHRLKPNDPYIIDSIGWAYYLHGKFEIAEKYLKEAVILMPLDPIVNDHYADILWKLNKNLQATYTWNYVLSLENLDEKMKKKIEKKVIFGI